MRGRRALGLVILLGATLTASLQVTAQNQNSPAQPTTAQATPGAAPPPRRPSHHSRPTLHSNRPRMVINRCPATRQASPLLRPSRRISAPWRHPRCSSAARRCTRPVQRLPRRRRARRSARRPQPAALADCSQRPGRRSHLPGRQERPPGHRDGRHSDADDDIKAIAALLHSLQAQGSNQGGPPPGPDVELNILVGDAKAGEAFFAAECASCHSASRRPAGHRDAACPMPKALQNLWVSGGVTAAAPRAGAPARVGAEQAHGDGHAALGREGAGPAPAPRRLPRHGRAGRRHARAPSAATAMRPTVEVQDPLDGHRELLGDPHQRQHARRDGLPGDAQMRLEATAV